MKQFFLFTISFFISLFAHFVFAQETNKEEFSITFSLENLEITTLSEGQGEGKTIILLETTPEIISQTAPSGNFLIATNAFLLKTPHQNILIDAGYGKMLLQNLKSQNVTPEQIDVILLTHLHGDHIGGLLKNGEIVCWFGEI